jgi:hypothetical protein
MRPGLFIVAFSAWVEVVARALSSPCTDKSELELEFLVSFSPPCPAILTFLTLPTTVVPLPAYGTIAALTCFEGAAGDNEAVETHDTCSWKDESAGDRCRWEVGTTGITQPN